MKQYKSIGWGIKFSDGSVSGNYPEKRFADIDYSNGVGSKVIELFEEVSKYEEWEIDKPCYLLDKSPVHFAGMYEGKTPCYWNGGKTSHSAESRIAVDELFANKQDIPK
jgi:hypothetical protein